MSPFSRTRLALLSVGCLALVALLFADAATAHDALWQPLPEVAPRVSPAAGAGHGLVLGLRALVVALVFLLAYRISRSLFGALAVTVALVFSVSFGAWSHTSASALWTAVFLLVAVASTTEWVRHRRPYAPYVTAAAALLAVVSNVGALTGEATGGASVAALPGAAALVSGSDRIRQVVTVVAPDFGLVGAVFLGLGILHLVWRRRYKLVLLSGWILGVAVWTLVAPAIDWGTAVVLISIPLWLLAAAGAGWIGALGQTRHFRWAAPVLLALLPVLTLGANYSEVARLRGASLFVDRYNAEMAGTVPEGTLVVNEGSFLDGFVPGARIPQDVDRVMAALRDGVPVLAFAGARQNLRELGFRFQAVPGAGVPMTISELLDSVPKGWIVAVAATPPYAMTVRPERSAAFATVGGREDLFGKTDWRYGLIGVKGRRSARLEEGAARDLDLTVKAGESVTDEVRAPVALRVTAHGERAAVEFRGAVVAESATGLAIVIVSPSGQLAAAFAPEFDRELTVRVNPPSLSAGLVVGREPCRQEPAGVWNDVTAVADAASLGGLLDERQAAVVYLAADHPLLPRQAPLRHRAVPTVSVAAFDLQRPDDRERFDSTVRADAVDTERRQALRESRHVYRVELTPAAAGRTQMALRLGGFPGRVLARFGPGAPVTLCPAMRPETDLQAVNLERNDLFLYGWNSVERAGDRPFRWTRAPRAEMVLPIQTPGPRVVAITAKPFAPPARGGEAEPEATVTLWVNGQPFSPMPLQVDTSDYHWAVPAEAWRAGMNRLQVAVSRLARPSDLGLGTDDRLLGLAVERIALLKSATSASLR